MQDFDWDKTEGVWSFVELYLKDLSTDTGEERSELHYIPAHASKIEQTARCDWQMQRDNI